jgi:hypothetical protein
LTQERAIRINERAVLSPDLSKPSQELDNYLSTLKVDCAKEEKHINRYRRMRDTRLRNTLSKPNITVEPIQQHKTWMCKKADKTNDFNLNPSAQVQTNDPAEGSLVIEQIKGIIVVCDFCGRRWTHHSKNLGRQYYTRCGICRRNVRLKHYQ